MKRFALTLGLLFFSAPVFAQAPVFCPTRPASDASNACASTQFVGTAILGLPGGTNGQVQYNNSSVFGGFTVGGDATLSTASGVLTLATVNSNVGTFGSATSCVTTTVNGKGLTTAISAATCTPAISSISGLGTGVATALGVNIGSAGAPVLFNGAGGTPSSITLTNGTGLPLSGLTGLGTGVATALGVNVGTAGAFVTNGGALGTPSSGTGTNLTGIPTTGLTGTLQAAQEPAHTGGVTNSAGSLALTVITNANLTGDVTSVGNASTLAAGNAGNLNSGTLLAARMPALTGDCTTSVGAVATTCLKTNGVSFTASATAAAGQLPGEPAAGNAAAGDVGEYVEGRFIGASATVTITIASPAVITWTSPPYAGSATTGTNWTAPISFTTTGTLPTGITASTVYWIIGNTLSGNTFQIATTAANALAATAINTSGSQSGTQTGNTLQPLTSGFGSPQDCAVIQLTAGDWDVRAMLYGDPTNAATSVTDTSAYLSTTINFANTTPGYFSQITGAAFVPGNGFVVAASIPPARFSSASVQAIHLVGVSVFTVSTMSQYCGMSARRVR